VFNRCKGYFLKATVPCVIAYSYARIRRLVCLVGGFYCCRVADESAIGFSSSVIIKARKFRLLCYGGYAWGTSVRRVP